jgi:hypothetical protein
MMIDTDVEARGRDLFYSCKWGLSFNVKITLHLVDSIFLEFYTFSSAVQCSSVSKTHLHLRI